MFPLTRGTLQFKGIHISRKKKISLISPNFLALSITVLSRKPLCLIVFLAEAGMLHMQELQDIQDFMDKTTIYHLSMCFKTVTVSNIKGVQWCLQWQGNWFSQVDKTLWTELCYKRNFPLYSWFNQLGKVILKASHFARCPGPHFLPEFEKWPWIQNVFL